MQHRSSPFWASLSPLPGGSMTAAASPLFPVAKRQRTHRGSGSGALTAAGTDSLTTAPAMGLGREPAAASPSSSEHATPASSGMQSSSSGSVRRRSRGKLLQFEDGDDAADTAAATSVHLFAISPSPMRAQSARLRLKHQRTVDGMRAEAEATAADAALPLTASAATGDSHDSTRMEITLSTPARPLVACAARICRLHRRCLQCTRRTRQAWCCHSLQRCLLHSRICAAEYAAVARW